MLNATESTEVLMSPAEFKTVAEALLNHRFIFAKTMPHNPHHYTLRKEWGDNDLFDSVVALMRRYGYVEFFRRRPYTMFNVNQYKFWTMGAPIHETILINRKPHLLDTPYSEIADDYLALFDSEPSREEERLAVAAARPTGTVLDVGCGAGMMLAHCDIDPAHYTGLDLSQRMLQLLAERHPDYAQRTVHAAFESYYGPPVDTLVSFFGSASYLLPESLARLPHFLQPGGRYFLMFYAPDYQPVTYTELNVHLAHYGTAGLSWLPDGAQVHRVGSYVVAEGGV